MQIKSQDKRVNNKLKTIRRVSAVMKKQADATAKYMPQAMGGDIEVESEMDRTFKMSQKRMETEVDLGTRKKLFNFDLPGGHFNLTPSKNGRHMLMTGNGGQASVIDRHTMLPTCDVTVGEPIVASTFLHDHSLFACAQRKYVYIYSSKSGEEVHCLRDHTAVTHMDYLPYHYLMVSCGEQGNLRYMDTSTGTLIAKHSTKQGACQALKQNSQTGVVTLGHTSGTVTMWTPTMGEAAVKMLCHYGSVSAVAPRGEYGLITSGQDLKIKVWDLRKPQQEVSKFSCVGRAASCIDISDTGKVAVGMGSRVLVWKDDVFKSGTKHPLYLSHSLPGDMVNSLKFCPFEDLLLMGSGAGIRSLLVPGSGSAEVDSFAGNPFQTLKQRREAEVRGILEKLKPDMIRPPRLVST